MFKVIFSLLLVSLSPLAIAQQNTGEWKKFSQEYKVAVENIVRDKNLDYWALPIAEDKDGIKQIRSMLGKMQSVNFRERPFLFRFSLAGVRYTYDKNKLKDPLVNEVEQALGQGMALAYVRCTGYYSNVKMPKCLIDFENGNSFQKNLLEHGYLAPSLNPAEVPADHQAILDQVAAQAKASEKGVWAPFFFMLEDMQGGF